MPTQKSVTSTGDADAIERLARVIDQKRGVLLRAYRTALSHEDLEDCYSQASIELLARAKRAGSEFRSEAHMANALEQKLRSRIDDVHRARGGRSPITSALADASALDELNEPADLRNDVVQAVGVRMELRSIIAATRLLSADQRLAMVHEALLDTRPEDFCRRFGWSMAKYRKVRQRARGKLRLALAGE